MRVESAALLWDVQDACQQVQNFVEGVDYAEYSTNALVRSAVERQLEIVGEALNTLRKIDPHVAEQVPDLHRIIGLRNVLIHGYAVVDNTIVWSAVTDRVPEIILTVQRLAKG